MEQKEDKADKLCSILEEQLGKVLAEDPGFYEENKNVKTVKEEKVEVKVEMQIENVSKHEENHDVEIIKQPEEPKKVAEAIKEQHKDSPNEVREDSIEDLEIELLPSDKNETTKKQAVDNDDDFDIDFKQQ